MGKRKSAPVSLVENERTKLLATALNNLGVATIITGVVAPVATALYGTAHPAYWWFTIAVVWIIVGLALHVLAQMVLGKLKP